MAEANLFVQINHHKVRVHAGLDAAFAMAGAAFGFDRVRAAASALSDGDAFERLAVRRLIEDLLSEQTALTREVMKFAGGSGGADDPRGALAGWSALHASEVRLVQQTIGDIERAGGGWSFAKLTIANAALREIAGGLT